jgi:pimeloyl-ACP methyl ester carboxylesterase
MRQRCASLLPHLSLLILLACNRPARPSAPAWGVLSPREALASAAAPSRSSPPEVPAVPAGAPESEPGPLQAELPFVDLSIEGYPAAIVSLPLGARRRRPVLVATHGNFDRPEWQCVVWREIVGDRAFVLCPRGFARPDSPPGDDARFSYHTNQTLEREVSAGLAALRSRFPAHADVDQPLYTGFSLGAIMGVHIAARNPAEYPRLLLVEGGHEEWTPASAAAFAKGGGRRVLFVCSQAWCENAARVAERRLLAAGVAARVVRGPDVGHRYDGPTAETTKRVLSWAIEDDPRWEDASPSL